MATKTTFASKISKTSAVSAASGLLLVAVIALSGCTPRPEGPGPTAEKFFGALAIGDTATVGTMDGEMLISLNEGHTPTAAHVADQHDHVDLLVRAVLANNRGFMSAVGGVDKGLLDLARVLRLDPFARTMKIVSASKRLRCSGSAGRAAVFMTRLGEHVMEYVIASYEVVPLLAEYSRSTVNKRYSPGWVRPSWGPITCTTPCSTLPSG